MASDRKQAVPPGIRGNHRGCGWLIVVALLASFPAFGVGWITGALYSDRERQNQDIAAAKRILAEHPDRFDGLWINVGPAPKFRIEGQVRSRDDYEQLRNRTIREFGEPRAEMLLIIDVLERPTSETPMPNQTN